VTTNQPTVLLDDRFELGSLLKRGNGVETYAGVDNENGALVIVKMVDTRHVIPAVRTRLEHEARVLERLDTAQFCRVVASGRQGDYFYLVQPHLPGETLAARLSHGALSVEDTLSIASDVLESLRLVHEAGILHRDIKPTNILVRGDVSIEGADLIDFGLARSSDLDASLRDDSVGTARYLAPCVAGLIKAEIDQRADLYSLGVVLFECLAGHPPFDGDSVGEVLRQHLNAEVPKLRAGGVVVPSAIDGLIQRMLAKDPQTRYQSAASVAADISNIQSQLFRGIPEPVLTLGINDRLEVLTEPTFVGRVEELAHLANLLTETQAGRGGLVLVEAESGTGKTRLLDELALQAVQAGLWVLRGRGVDQAAVRPFQVFDGVVSEIVAAESDETRTRGIRERIGDWAPSTVAALPALGTIFGQVGHAHLGPEAFGEARNIDALSALLDTLGQGDRPALVLLDDCQWVDDMTIELLRRWQTDRGPADRRYVLVVVAFRSEEVSTDSALRMHEPLATLVLQPFGAADIEALCASMAGALPPTALSTIARLADGSPFMASAILRGMVESGALRETEEGWTVEAEPMQHVQTSRRAAAFLAQRFDLLGSGALEVLSVGAILGKEFNLDLAAVLAGYTNDEVTETLREARHRSILWIDEVEGTCSFAHDKLREALLDRLEPEQRRQLHQRAAETIELTDPARVFEIAFHFDAAGDPVSALPYALVAAEQARQQHALEASVRHYRIAERATQDLGAQADDTQLALIAEGLGDVLTLQGDYAEAIEQLERAHSLTADRMDRAGIEAKLGNVAFKRGDQAMASQYLEGALRDLGRWVPRNGVSVFLATLGEVVVQFLHTLMPRLFVGRRSPEGKEREFAAIRMYGRLTYIYWFSAGTFPCAWAHLRELNLAERYPASPELAQAYSTHAPVMTMIPWFRRGLAYAQRSIAIRRDLGDVWGEGQSLNFYGVVLYASSRYRECIEACGESMRLLKHTGDQWEQNTAAWHQAFSHYRLGELETAVELARDVYASASAIGDTTSAGITLSGWSRAGVGNIPESLIATELARDLGDAHTTTEVLLADGVRLLYKGQVDAAVDRLEQARAGVKEAGLRQEYVAPVRPWLSTALRMRVEAIDAHGPRDRARQLRRAARMARSADLVSRSYRNNRPHSLRERALIANLQGRSSRANRLLARSLVLANEQGALYEASLTRVAMARLAVVNGRPDASIELADAEAQRLEFEAHRLVEEQPTLSLADRFDTLLDVGRQIGAAASSPAVFAAVYDAAVQLLRGDRCHVIMFDEDPMVDFTTESGEPVTDLSMSVLARAVATESPVVSGVVADADLGDSLILADLRSVLCAPILSGGRVVACFYLTHHQVDGLFGDEEIQMAEFIATLAGAALDQVAGSEAHFRSLAQHSSDVITIVDPSGHITYQSASVERVFGYAPEELLHCHLSTWLHPDDADELLMFLEPSHRGQEASGLIQTRMCHRDGTWRFGESVVRNLSDDPRVGGLVLNTRDASERVALESELRAQALHDPLTGLANRALFVDRVENALARRARDQRPLSVLFVDLDDFKLINDTLGHGVGDQVLRQTGQRLNDCVRPSDMVARFGGDEFALLLEDADMATAANIASRVVDEFVRPFQIFDQEVFSRASVGIAVSLGEVTTEDLIAGADTAMYVSKSNGKARYEFFAPAMRDVAIDRSALRSDLEWATTRAELAIDYQPIVDLSTGSLSGFEALVRWDHPTRGRLGPDQFIDLAEQSGLIIGLGGWVLRTACSQVAVWQKKIGRELTIAVNISARQLQDPGLTSKIRTALAVSDLPPHSLVLEITESATVEDTESAIEVLNALKALGVRIAIDDFGTGYSSLSYLRRFPVDQLKVDRSFISEFVTNPEDLAIVSSVINLGHSLGLSVVAEGVESADQLLRLNEMKCDEGQGFIWRRPANAHDVSQWLESADGRLATV